MEIKRTERIIGGIQCFEYLNPEADCIILQPVGDQEEGMPERILKEIRKLSKRPFSYYAIHVSNWNKDISPWEAPAAFGSEIFGNGAEETLRFITGELLPEIRGNNPSDEEKPVIAGGYSLAALFTLWAAYQTDQFRGIAAASPSVWFPGWMEYIRSREIRSDYVYLSLGTKEEKTRNCVMAQVGGNIRQYEEILRNSPACRESFLEWNPGTHFTDPALRTAKGFAWVLERAGK